MGIDLLPVIAAPGSSGSEHLPDTTENTAIALLIEKGSANGPEKLRASLVGPHLASKSLPTIRSKTRAGEIDGGGDARGVPIRAAPSGQCADRTAPSVEGQTRSRRVPSRHRSPARAH